MCLAVPGKIVKIEKDEATIDYELEMRKGKIVEGDFKVGDFVIVQGGFIITKVPEKEAISALNLYKEAVSQTG